MSKDTTRNPYGLTGRLRPFSQEPVRYAALVRGLLLVAIAFGLTLSENQVEAVVTVVLLFGDIFTSEKVIRSQVTPYVGEE